MQTGRPFEQFGDLRSREILANWLLCVATGPNRLDFASDPQGGDGIIIDSLTGETWNTEHILVPQSNDTVAIEESILAAVVKQQKRAARVTRLAKH